MDQDLQYNFHFFMKIEFQTLCSLFNFGKLILIVISSFSVTTEMYVIYKQHNYK